MLELATQVSQAPRIHRLRGSALHREATKTRENSLSLTLGDLILSSWGGRGGRERARGRESAPRAGAGAPDRRRVCAPYLCWPSSCSLCILYTCRGAGDGAGRRATARRRARAPRGAGRVSGVSRVWPAGCGRARDARAARRHRPRRAARSAPATRVPQYPHLHAHKFLSGKLSQATRTLISHNTHDTRHPIAAVTYPSQPTRCAPHGFCGFVLCALSLAGFTRRPSLSQRGWYLYPLTALPFVALA
jgi:hypothetical protein